MSGFALTNTAVIGITDYAQESLGSIVYVDLGAVGDRVEIRGVRSRRGVKAASDLIAPVTERLSRSTGSRR